MAGLQPLLGPYSCTCPVRLSNSTATDVLVLERVTNARCHALKVKHRRGSLIHRGGPVSALHLSLSLSQGPSVTVQQPESESMVWLAKLDDDDDA
eukprot:1541916-Rhodomonas_salina.1